MPRRLFKTLSRQRHHLRTRWFMKPFAFVFGDAAYWSVNRRNVTRAVALGCLIAFIPPPIPHTLTAVIIAILFRVNIPVTLTATFITNPFTMLPLFYAAYRTGCIVMNIDAVHTLPSDGHWWNAWTQGPLLHPFLLGSLLLGLAVAVIGYVVLGLSWHLSLVYRLYKRKRLRRTKEQQADIDL